TAVVAITAAQHLHLVGNYLRAVAILAGFLVLPPACFETAFNINGPSFFEIFTRNFGKAIKEDDAMPFSFLAPLAGSAVAPDGRGGQRDVTDSRTIRAVTDLRVPPKVAYQNYLID